MIGFTLPSAAWLVKRYGLMVGDQYVTLLTWKSGRMEQLGQFGNDPQGLNDFTAFLKTRGNEFRGKAINIIVSVVGEDYRFERVAHLVGKYRTDMLARKFQQMFRGAQYHMASFQGREPVGRRQDMFLFCGILSGDKVQPWVRDLNRVGFSVAGVHLASMGSRELIKLLTKDKRGAHVVSICGKGGSVRHNFFVDGKLRFSRASRIPADATPETMYRSVRGEVEKTSSYLVSIKLVQPSTKFTIHVLCADDLVSDLNEISARNAGDRFTVNATSARLAGIALGIKKPIEEFGRDSSLVVHEILRSINFTQLAPINEVRYYFASTFSRIAVTAIVVWGLFNVFGIATNALAAYNQYSSENTELIASIRQLRGNYENQVEGFGIPPSSPDNMRSAVNVLDNVSGGGSSGPGKLMLYISKLLETNRSVQIDGINWYISNDIASNTGEYSFANGQKVYEVIELSGYLDEDVNPEFAFNQYKAFIEILESRGDMAVTEIEEPALFEAGGELVVEIDELTDIRGDLNAFTTNRFNIAVSWEPAATEGNSAVQ